MPLIERFVDMRLTAAKRARRPASLSLDGNELRHESASSTTMAHMDLFEALQRMVAPVDVPGRSDLALAASVQAGVDSLVADAVAAGTALPIKPVIPAVGVNGGIVSRPIDALLRLARATRPLISDDVYDWYRHWGWLRYLGIFDWRGDGTLGLSAAGLGVRANQRRVMSEDLGVGFGCVVADRWCSALGALGPVVMVDIDLALNEGRRWLQRHGANPAVRDRQPDYLLVYPDPGDPRSFSYKSLECKGTVSSANVNGQLARAITQLGSLELSGVSPQGIAVATVSNGAGVQYFAVDPDDGRDTDSVYLTDQDLAHARQSAEMERSRDGSVHIGAGDLIATSLFMSAGTLADYGGNGEAAGDLLPPSTLRRLSRRRPDRVFRETNEGVFRGVEYQFPTPDGARLEVFMGIAEGVDNALTTGDVDQITEAQINFGRQRQQSGASVGTNHVAATSGDGAILLLRA